MDIRDIKEEPVYPKDCGLTGIFELQKELLNHYIGIESLPQYPIDINTKKSQVLIKDFTGRVIEELGEAWESYEYMLTLKDKGDDRKLLIPHLQNYNEEISDAIHFFVELLIYSGISIPQIRSALSHDLGEQVSPNSDLLEEFLKLGHYRNDKLHYEAGLAPSYWVIRNRDLKDEFLRGGRELGQAKYKAQKELLWDITYHIQIARNTLKNKPWKQTQMMTDEQQYKYNLYNAIVAMFSFFAFAGFTKESLFYIYFKKNRVNLFRIKSKY